MKIIIATFFLVTSIILVKGQPITFEKTVDYDHSIDNAGAVVVTDSGYVFWGNAVEPILNNWEGIELFKTGLTGEIIWKKMFGKEYFNYYGGLCGNLIKTHDSGFAACGSEVDSVNQVYAAALFRFDENGDTLWIARFNNHAQQWFQNCRETPDLGFILTGVYRNTNNGTDYICLTKTDSLGHLQWEQTYSIRGYGNGVETTKDGGYIIGGTIVKYTGHNGGLVIKTDSLGNIQWQQSYATHSGYDGNTLVANSRFGGYLICACLDTVIRTGDYQYAYLIAHVDTGGNTLWGKYITNPNNSLLDIYSIQELDDGSIVLAGGKALQDTSQELGLIIKLDSVGNKIWDRTNFHTTFYGTLKGPNTITDMKPTDDKGFICTGFAVDDSLLDNGLCDCNTNFWLLKTDSLGYVYYPPDTDTTDTTGIIVPEEIGIKLYPNPASNQLTVELPSAQRNTTLILYDLLGQAVIEKRLTDAKTHIDVTALPQGLYIYRIGNAAGKVQIAR